MEPLLEQDAQIKLAENQARGICYLLCLISLSKLTLSIWLIETDIRAMVFIVSIYDLAYILELYFLWTRTNLPQEAYNRTQFRYDSNIGGFVLEQLWGRFQPVNGLTVIQASEQYHRRVGQFSEILRLFHLTIFVLLNAVSWKHPLIKIYIICSYIYLSIPLSLCVVWPILLFVLLWRRDIYESRSNTPRASLMDQLKYSKGLTQEAYILMHIRVFDLL